jgi:uncharacterized protein with ParB-like and HNH nuclease domain
MDNRVYYGEYSLEHWINLILKKNITLPPYQRYFVWNERKVATLIDTLRKKQFVPPVTIGAFKIGDTNQNLILDGQQRLTSILLAYIGIYPDEQTYKTSIERFASESDEDEEESEDFQFDNILEWNINILTEKGNNKEAILKKIAQGNYKSINIEIDDDFLKTTFLGFSYLVPQISDEKEQQKYYSSVFRNINIQGEPLLAQESRAALYFLDQDLVEFFTPAFCKTIVIKMISSEAKADFVRYLSLLSNYYKNGNASRVARGYKPKMEKFYEEYIYAAINNHDSETYGKFSEVLPNKKYAGIFEKVQSTLELLNIPGEYPSIIDLDIYLFGLFYHIIFNKASIDEAGKDELKEKLDNEIQQSKSSESHRRSPNNLGHLRNRISQSIQIYEGHLSQES